MMCQSWFFFSFAILTHSKSLFLNILDSFCCGKYHSNTTLYLFVTSCNQLMSFKTLKAKVHLNLMFFNKTTYTGSLASVNFSGAVFTHAHFPKTAQISSLCNFHYISEGIPSFMCFWLLMAINSAADVSCWFLLDLEKRPS